MSPVWTIGWGIVIGFIILFLIIAILSLTFATLFGESIKGSLRDWTSGSESMNYVPPLSANK